MSTNKFGIKEILLPAVFLLILLAACQDKTQNTKVTLESDREEKLQLGIPKRIIKLEMTSESVLGNISKVQTDFDNDRIFVLSGFNIYIFNASGKFIAKLSKGKGPEEVSMVMACSLNKKDRSLYILDNTNRICVIDYNGRFLRQAALKSFYAIDIQALDTESVLLLNYKTSDKEPWFVAKYNLASGEVEQKFIPITESKYPEYFMITQNSFHFSSSHKTFSASNIFNLYEYKENDFQKTIEYDLGKRTVPNNFLETMKNKRKSEFGEYASENGYVPYLLSSFYYKNYILAILEDENRSCYVIDAENYNSIYMNGSLSGYFGLSDLFSFTFPMEVCDDYMVFAVNPTDFFSEDAAERSTTVQFGDQTMVLSLEENPFLVIVE